MSSVAFTHHAFSAQRRGGITRYFVELARALPAQGWRAEILACIHINEHLAEAGVKVTGWRSRFDRALRLRHRLNDRLTSLLLERRRPAVVHETYYPFRPYRRGRRPVVVTVHDMIHERFPQFVNATDHTAEWKATAVRAADHVICISETTRADVMERYNLPADSVSVVHHGRTRLPAAAIDPPYARPYLLYVGARGGYKNFPLLLRVLATSRAAAGYDLVCFGGPPFSGEELRLIQSARLGKRVQHRSGADHTLAALYSGACALVYPSRYEGFGLPLLEAMSLGCPVASSRGGALPEVGGDAAAYFDPADADEMRHVIERVIEDRTLREDLRRRGLERAQLFSWERCARETAEIYTNLVPTSRTAARVPEAI